MDIIDDEMKPYHIATLKKQLDRAELNNICHEIDEQCLITILKHHNIKRDTKTRHKINYMGVGARVQSHKSRLKKKIDDVTFEHLKNPVNPERHRPMTLDFNVVNKFVRKLSNQGDVDHDKQTDIFKNLYKKNE